jgi:hypothetical protein
MTVDPRKLRDDAGVRDAPDVVSAEPEPRQEPIAEGIIVIGLAITIAVLVLAEANGQPFWLGAILIPITVVVAVWAQDRYGKP